MMRIDRRTNPRSICGMFAFVLLARCGLAADVDYFANNGFDNSISQLQHPCAEHFRGKTYLAYQGPHEDAYICVYDHAAQKWQGPVLAGVSTMGSPEDPVNRGEADNHGKPALIVDDIGHVHLIFGGHGGDYWLGENRFGAPGRGKQTHVMTTNPEDISTWKIVDNIDPFGTYSQFVKMDNGDLYLFYRHGAHWSDWVYQKSTDQGRTFEPPISILKHKTQDDDPNVHDSWYAWFTKGKGSTVVVMYVYHPCKAVGHDSRRSNVYFMRMNCNDGTWESASKEPLTIPVTKEHADVKALVFDSGKTRCSRGICGVDATGAPHILFAIKKGQAQYTRWLGNSWQEPLPVTTDAGSQEGDMIIDSATEVRLLLTGHSEGGSNEVRWWKTKDGGRTWLKESLVLSSRTSSFNLGTFTRNFHPDGQILIEESDESVPNLYRKMLLWGNNGFLGRSSEEADKMAIQLNNLIAAQPKDEKARAERAEKAARKKAKKGIALDE